MLFTISPSSAGCLSGIFYKIHPYNCSIMRCSDKLPHISVQHTTTPPSLHSNHLTVWINNPIKCDWVFLKLKAFALTQDEVGRKYTDELFRGWTQTHTHRRLCGASAGYVTVMVFTSVQTLYLLFPITLCLHICHERTDLRGAFIAPKPHHRRPKLTPVRPHLSVRSRSLLALFTSFFTSL